MNPLQMPQIIDWNIARKIGMVPAAASASVTLEEWYQAVQGGWIKFPATQNPSSDPNTLDDYEEGTWTPTIGSATGTFTTVSTVAANYTKIGREVKAYVVILITTNGTAAGYVTCTMPFTCNATQSCALYGRETDVSGAQLQGYIASGSNVATIWTSGNAYPGGNGYRLVITCNYFV